jgi:hypothetical protein
MNAIIQGDDITDLDTQHSTDPLQPLQGPNIWDRAHKVNSSLSLYKMNDSTNFPKLLTVVRDGRLARP